MALNIVYNSGGSKANFALGDDGTCADCNAAADSEKKDFSWEKIDILSLNFCLQSSAEAARSSIRAFSYYESYRKR